MIATSFAAAILMTATPVADTTIATYVGALSNVDPEVGQALAEPNSPAYWYATYQSLHQLAFRDAGDVSGPMTTHVVNGTAEVCYGGDQAMFETDPCTQLNSFTESPDGLIISCTVDGNELAPRLGVASEAVAVGSTATATVLVSYQRQDGSLAVILALEAIGPTSFSNAITYVNPDGRQVEAIADIGPSDILSGAHATFLATFPASLPGGRLAWQASTVDAAAVTFEIPVPH